MSKKYGIHVDDSKTTFNPFVMANDDEVAERIIRILRGQPMLEPLEDTEQVEATLKRAE